MNNNKCEISLNSKRNATVKMFVKIKETNQFGKEKKIFSCQENYKWGLY